MKTNEEWWVTDGLDPEGHLNETYLSKPEQWETLARVVRAAGGMGLDTEFYGLDVRKESCVGRAVVHVWSVAVRTKRRSPLGFYHCVGWVLPRESLTYPALKAILEDPTIRKPCHNQPVDDHAIHNAGVRLRGCVNTLGLARWKWPWLVTAGGFGLKNLMNVKLRRDIVCTFKELVSDTRVIEVPKFKKINVTLCSCGETGCRKRKGHEKTKRVDEVVVMVQKEEKFQHPLESIVPGHSKFPLLVKYAAEDAVAADETLQLAERERDPAPFPYGNVRQGCNQELEDAIVLMEREGFPIDTDYAYSMVLHAEELETKELEWLRKWHAVNVADENQEVDGIWSSPKQLAEMFEELGIPRSPIWKKGKAKPGEIKLDATALKWIARNYAPARQMIGRLLQLKKVRAGKKYMVKLANSGGWVNVICGPAGDADDRNGAVTGRLGIKGTLEAQQLPTREEIDLFQVRKAIVAADMRN